MSFSTVQFKTGQAALQAFKNTECQAWSVNQGKQLLYKGIGPEDLDSFLQLLSDGASNAVYTICYYEGITDKKEIKSNTPNDGSFNFRLNSDGQEITTYQYNKLNNFNAIESKIGALENKFDTVLNKLNEEIEEEEKPNGGALGIIGEILSHPAISPIVPTILQNLLSGLMGQNFAAGAGGSAGPGRNLSQLAAVGNITTMANISEQEAIKKAIDILLIADPKLSEHLTKLANLAQKDPNSFAMITASLDGYQMA